MRQNTLIFLLLASLCLQINTFPLRETNFLNAHVTSSGVINLQKEYPSTYFYVEADFSSYSSQSSISDIRKVMISIANRETLVAERCLSFSTYDCNRYECKRYDTTNRFDFPTFTANVQYANGYIDLDSSYWKLTSDFLYIAQSCETGDTSSSLGSNNYGVLGLGMASKGQNSDIFSIWIKSDLTEGKLLFKKDISTYAQSSTPIYTLNANSTWQLQAESGKIQIDSSSSSISFSGNVMFDVNSDAIGLPSSVYDSFLSAFIAINNVYCDTGDTYRPYCYTTLQLKDLPDITLSFKSQQIKIPFEIYASFSSDSGVFRYFYLNFKSTNPSMAGKSYVSPSFKDSIILDANFMSYYYAVFALSSGSNVISLYLSTNAPDSQPGSIKWSGIGAVGGLLLVIICCWAWKKRKSVSVQAPRQYYSQPQGGYVPPAHGTNF